MAEGMENTSEYDDILGIVKNGGGFCFSRRTNDMAETSTLDENWMVWSARENAVWSILKIVIPGDSAPSFQRNEVSRIRINMQVHIAFMVT